MILAIIFHFELMILVVKPVNNPHNHHNHHQVKQRGSPNFLHTFSINIQSLIPVKRHPAKLITTGGSWRGRSLKTKIESSKPTKSRNK